MKTLVYLASGKYDRKYEDLNFDQIILVDRCLRPFSSSKVIGLQMDALEARQYFIDNNIKIDCLVCLCESRGEGGQSYAMCSDSVIGYYMPVLQEEFIWICNDSSYYSFASNKLNHPPRYSSFDYQSKRTNEIKNSTKLKIYPYNLVSLDLPYEMQELSPDDSDYLSPLSLSNFLSVNNIGCVFKMKFTPSIQSFSLKDNLIIRLINDSIWNYYQSLDHLYISFKIEEPEMREWFENKPKVSYYHQEDFESCLEEAKIKGYRHIGFTPHYWYQYEQPYQKSLEHFCLENSIDITIDFFYLNSWFKTRFIEKAIKTIERRGGNNTESNSL